MIHFVIISANKSSWFLVHNSLLAKTIFRDNSAGSSSGSFAGKSGSKGRVDVL